MRSILAKELRAQFERTIKNRVPTLIPCKGEGMPPGDRLYRWGIGAKPAFFVSVLPHHQNDAFTLEIAYSDCEKWPQNIFMFSETDPEVSGSKRFRISQLFPPDQRKDYWWWLVKQPNILNFDSFRDEDPSEALSKVQPLIDDAVTKLVEYAIPYFRRVETSR